jgi:hypothetical protein
MHVFIVLFKNVLYSSYFSILIVLTHAVLLFEYGRVNGCDIILDSVE